MLGQSPDDKKPKITRIKVKIVYFEAKRVRNLEFSENFLILELEQLIAGTF